MVRTKWGFRDTMTDPEIPEDIKEFHRVIRTPTIEERSVDLRDGGPSCFIAELTDHYVVISDRCPLDCEEQKRRDENYGVREEINLRLLFDLEDEDDLRLRDDLRRVVENDEHRNIGFNLTLSCHIGDLVGWPKEEARST